MKRLIDFIQELKRRKVFQVASLYLVTAWGASLGAAELLPAFGAPDGAVRALVIGLLLFFPVVVALAWYFELTQSGIVRDPRDLPDGDDGDEGRRGATTVLAGPVRSDLLVGMMWQENGRQQTRYFSESFEIGRSAGCELSTLDPQASRRHARIELRKDSWWVVDLNSSNGLLLDGVRVTEASLPPVCSIQLGPGGQTFDVRVEDRAAETRIAPPPPDGP